MAGGTGEVSMLEFFTYVVFFILMFGCLRYIMNALETEDAPGKVATSRPTSPAHPAHFRTRDHQGGECARAGEQGQAGDRSDWGSGRRRHPVTPPRARTSRVAARVATRPGLRAIQAAAQAAAKTVEGAGPTHSAAPGSWERVPDRAPTAAFGRAPSDLRA